MPITLFTNLTSVTSDPSNQANSSLGQRTSGTAGLCHELKETGLLPGENLLNSVSPETEKLVDSIKAAIVVPVVFITGCPANCVSLAVFCKMGLKTRINTCLFILSLVNLFKLVFFFVLYWERSFALSSSRFGPTYRFIVENHILGLVATSWAARFVTTVVTSERCFCIYHPLRSQTLLTTKTMAIFLTLSCLVITFGFFVVSEKFNLICIYDAQRNATFWQLSKATSYYIRYQHIIDVFDGTVYGFLLPLIYGVVDVGCCTAMVVKIRKTLSWRNSASSAVPHKEILLTKMLICLSIQHNVISAPDFCFRTASMFIPDLRSSGKYFNTLSLMLNVSEMLMYLNSCSPFFVYYFVGSKFRQTLHEMLNLRKNTSYRRKLPKS